MTQLKPAFSSFRRSCRWLALAAMLLGGSLAVDAQESAPAPAAAATTVEPGAPPVPAAATTHDAHLAADPHAADAHGAGHGGAVHHGLPTAAPILFNIGPLAVNNSMVLTWVVAAFIILFSQIAMRNMKEVPDGAQNFWEWLVESLRNFLENIIGRDLTKTTFWFFATVFIFILASNWFGLLPGVGTIGWGVPDANGTFHHFEKPLARGANADLNLTLAMAIVFFICWIYWALRANGFGGLIFHIFGAKGDTKGIMKFFIAIVFALVGVLEIISILFRPVSLSFRLYGNIFAGENMLEAMANLIPPLAPIIPIPFYFLEILVGFVQALVFMLLTAVFTFLICSHDDSHGSKEHSHH